MDKEKIKKAVKEILEAIGENPNREGLLETPKRVSEMFDELLSGYGKDPKTILKTFTAKNYDEIILLKDIPIYSLCEHHLLPFFGKAHVAYIPKNGKVTGLSKISRVVETISRRLQVQEKLTTEIADIIQDVLQPQGLMVVIEAEHLCMSMRGVKHSDTITITSAVRGIFRKNKATREETLSLIRGTKP